MFYKQFTGDLLPDVNPVVAKNPRARTCEKSGDWQAGDYFEHEVLVQERREPNALLTNFNMQLLIFCITNVEMLQGSAQPKAEFPQVPLVRQSLEAHRAPQNQIPTGQKLRFAHV